MHEALDEGCLPAASRGADESAHWREGLATLVNSIKQLPEQTRQIFILYHLDGMNHSEIAHQLDISLRSVERHMAYALKHCKDRLGDYLDA